MVNNANGKDEEIVNTGGEENVDAIENIKLIDMEEYNSLKKSEQEKYVVYNPGLTSEAYAMLLTQANGIIDLFNQIGPMMSKLSPLTQGGMDLLNADAFVNLINAVKVPADLAQQLGSLIGTISSTPIVSIVAKPLELICGAVGALAGLVYALVMNPYNMLSAYYSAIKQLDLETLKNSFSKDSIPNLEIAKMELNEVVIPDPDIKSYVDNGINDTMQMVDNATQMLDTAVNLEATMESLQTADKQMRTYLKTINTMGMNWLLPQIQQLCDILELNYEAIADSLCNNHYTSFENMASNHVNGFMNNLPLKFIHVNDLELLKTHQQKQQQKDDYQSGNDDGYDDGEDLFEEYLETFENVSEINEVEMWKYRDEKLEEKVKELEKDKDNNSFYISGYREGFKKGFEEKYIRSKQTDYENGIDDGKDEGENDGERMASKLLLANMTNENLEEYITKSISEKELTDKSLEYKEGYTEGYKEAFYKEVNTLKNDEYDEGYNIGLTLGDKICSEVLSYSTKSNSHILNWKSSINDLITYSNNIKNVVAWKASTSYAVNAKVKYNDCVYICKTKHTSSSTFASANWNVSFNLKGTYGITEAELNEALNWYNEGLEKDTKNKTQNFINGYNDGVEVSYNKSIDRRKTTVTKKINKQDEENGYDDGVTAGESAGQSAMTSYETVLTNSGITGVIDRYMAHDKNHDTLFNNLNPSIPDGSSYYQTSYTEGYYYGFTKGYYSSLEIF